MKDLRRAKLLCICALVGLASCSSTTKVAAGGSGNACGAAFDGGAGMTWLFNGTSECSISSVTLLETSSLLNLLTVGGETPGVAMGFSVANGTANRPSPAPLPGTYSCSTEFDGGPTLDVEFSYSGVTITQCTITIAQEGTAIANAQGTFAASGVGPDGGSISITNGSYNLPLTMCEGDGDLPCPSDGGPPPIFGFGPLLGDAAADSSLSDAAVEGSFDDAASDSALGDSATDSSFGDAGLDANPPDGSDD